MALVAMKFPNRNVWLWVSLGTSCVFLFAVATAFGSSGKLRLQCVSGCVLATIFYLGGSFRHSPFWEAESLSRSAIERYTKVLTPRTAPDGSVVYQDQQGNYSLQRGGTSSWEQVTLEEIERSKLTKYIVTDSNAISEDAFISIHRHLIALFVAWCGFAVTGLAYESRCTKSQRN